MGALVKMASNTVAVRLPEQVLEELQRLADLQNKKVSDIVRMLIGTGIAKLSPGATRSCKALPGKCFKIWKFLRCFAKTVGLSQTGNFLIA